MNYKYSMSTPIDGGDKTLTIYDSMGNNLMSTKNQKTIGVVEMLDNDGLMDEALTNIITNRNRAIEEFRECGAKFNAIDMQEEKNILTSHNPSSNVTAFINRVINIKDIVVRESLKKWISSNPSLSVTEEGSIIGYKGVKDDFHSVRAGYGVINGTPVDGHHDCTPGNHIEMPRELVCADPNVSCSFGLHVGNLEYARNWSTKTVRVMFHPEDVVSVAGESEKLRVCNYVIIDDITNVSDEKVMEGLN